MGNSSSLNPSDEDPVQCSEKEQQLTTKEQLKLQQIEIEQGKKKIATLEQQFTEMQTKIDKICRIQDQHIRERMKKQREQELETNIRKRIKIEESERQAIREKMLKCKGSKS